MLRIQRKNISDKIWMLQKLTDSTQLQPANPKQNSTTSPHKSYRSNIMTSSDPNITTSPDEGCSIYTKEKKSHDITNPELDKIVLH